MLTQLEIENFQSLRNLSLRLGRFTVVTGATGSGKSAVIRAARLLAFNARGTSYISHGAKSCRVQAGIAERALRDGWAVAIERGIARGKDCYALAPLGDAEPQTFTKLGGEVPEQVTRLLQLSDLNFADQTSVGRPFLLDSSGGEVARVLGKLTNVTLLFEAARECNRRRLEVRGDLKRAEAHLASLTEAAQRFAGMRDRQAAVDDAEAALERVQATSARLAALRTLTARLEAAEAALSRAVPSEVPAVGRLDDLAGRRARLLDLAVTFERSKVAAEGAYVRAMDAVQVEQAAHERLHQVLVEAGQCPTCGREVSAV